MSSRQILQSCLQQLILSAKSSSFTSIAQSRCYHGLSACGGQALHKGLTSSCIHKAGNFRGYMQTSYFFQMLAVRPAAGLQCGATNRICTTARRCQLQHGAGKALQPSCNAAAFAVKSRTALTGVMGPRTFSTGLSNLDAAVRDKARRMSVWVGGLAGIFGSFVGVGGGVLISPIIANACRTLPQRIISGTSLAAVVAVGSASGYVYWTSGYVDLMSVLLVASTAVLTAPLGAKATHKVDSARLRSMLGYWLYLVAPLIPLKSFIFSTLPSAEAAEPHHNLTNSPAAVVNSSGVSSEDSQGSSASIVQRPLGPVGHGQPRAQSVTSAAHQQSDASSSVLAAAVATPGWPSGLNFSLRELSLRELRSSDVALSAVGGIAGFASGLLGIGGGTIVTPLLAMATGMPQASVVGTSLAAMVFPAVVGLAQHTRLGNVDWMMAAGLVGGSFAGSFLSSHVAVHAPPMVMEWAFAIGMAYLGHKTLKIKTK